MNFTMTKIAAGMLLAIAATGAQAYAQPMDGVFNMYSKNGLDQNPGASVLTGPLGVDSTTTGFFDYSAGTWGVASTALFFGQNWTASNGQLIKTPGTYALNTTTGAISSAAPDFVGTKDGNIHFTVGVNQMGGAIDFAWGTSAGIRIVDVWTISNVPYVSNSYNPPPLPTFALSATTVPGMENGPFAGYQAVFNFPAPIPEASTYGMMLAGLGLVGGMASRRRKLMA